MSSNSIQDIGLWPLLRKVGFDFFKNLENCYIFNSGRSAFLLTKNKRIYSLGKNDPPILGFYVCEYITQRSPVEIERLRGLNISKIIDHIEYVLVLTEYGDLYSWGSGIFGELGFDPMMYRYPVRAQYIPRLIKSGIKLIANGCSHVLAVDFINQIWTWGSNEKKQVNPSLNDLSQHSPILMDQIPRDQSIIDITCAAQTSLVLTKKRSIYVWGEATGGRIIHQDFNLGECIYFKMAVSWSMSRLMFLTSEQTIHCYYWDREKQKFNQDFEELLTPEPIIDIVRSPPDGCILVGKYGHHLVYNDEIGSVLHSRLTSIPDINFLYLSNNTPGLSRISSDSIDAAEYEKIGSKYNPLQILKRRDKYFDRESQKLVPHAENCTYAKICAIHKYPRTKINKHWSKYMDERCVVPGQAFAALYYHFREHLTGRCYYDAERLPEMYHLQQYFKNDRWIQVISEWLDVYPLLKPNDEEETSDVKPTNKTRADKTKILANKKLKRKKNISQKKPKNQAKRPRRSLRRSDRLKKMALSTKKNENSLLK